MINTSMYTIRKFYLYIFTLVLCAGTIGVEQVKAQEVYGTIVGNVTNRLGNTIEGATISIDRSSLQTDSDVNGQFRLDNLTAATHTLIVRALGYQNERLSVKVSAGERVEVQVVLDEDNLNLNEVVVSATRYGVD